MWRFCRVAVVYSLALRFLPTVNGGDVAVRHIVDPPSASVLQSRAIHVFLRANRPDVFVSDISLSLSEELRVARADLGAETIPLTEIKGASLAARLALSETVEKELIFRYQPGPFWAPLRNANLLRFEPGQQFLAFRAKAEAYPLTQSADIDLPLALVTTAPTLAIMLGGACGALLLALLRVVYRHLRSKGKSIGWQAELRECIVAVSAGGLIALTMTFVGGLLSHPNFGIQLAATSWQGGIIIGLFSYKVGDFLAQKLWDEPPPPKAKPRH